MKTITRIQLTAMSITLSSLQVFARFAKLGKSKLWTKVFFWYVLFPLSLAVKMSTLIAMCVLLTTNLARC